jgi:cytochrome c55X
MRRWVSVLLVSSACAAAAWAAPDGARQVELLHLLQQDCGSCHGLTLRGGLGPSLLPEALDGKPAPFLVQTILDGRPGTAMPPWRPLLSESEAAWLVECLLAGEGVQ